VEVVAVSRRVQTLLFTDIVGSTDRLRNLGDAAWAALLVRHRGVIRAGLHTGEVELDGGRVAGVGVHLAARVMAEASAGQVLVTSTVCDLMAGSGFGFVDLGVRELRGFAERWRLFSLDPATVQGADGEAEPAASEPVAEGGGGTVVPFPGLLSVERSAGYVGREELLGRLEQTRRQAAAGRCRAVLLCGEPGIGKWVGELDRARARVVLSGGDPFDEATMLDDTGPPPLAEHPVYPARPEVAAQPTPV
jgi:hypothetical protein